MIDFAGFGGAGAQRHAALAGSTDGNAGQEDWTRDDARCDDLRTSGVELTLHLVKGRPINDCRHFRDDHLVLGFPLFEDV